MMEQRKYIRSGTGLNRPVDGLAGSSGQTGDSGSQNTDKNESSLALGSAGYREYLEDKAGIDEKMVVGGSPALESGGPLGHMEIDENVRRESDEYQATKALPEAEHVQVLSGDLRDAAQAQRDSDSATSVRKYRNRMAKLDKYGDVMKAMRRQAAITETTEDDDKVEKLSKRDCDDMPEILNDGITADDFTPRSFRKYM